MKADLSSLLPLPLGRIRTGETVPFALFLHLPRNGRMVAVCAAGDLPSPALLEALGARGVQELWAPVTAERAVTAYLEQRHAQDLDASGEPLPAETKEGEEEGGEVLDREEEDELGELASAAVRGLLGSDSTEDEARDQLAAECGAVADALLAGREDPFFESVRMLRSLQPRSHHSVMVGNVAAALNAALGGDPDLGAELVAAGTLHDIGLALIPRGQPEDTADPGEHVLTAVSLLRACTDPVPEGVVALVREHHARQDRKGFPAGLAPGKLRKGSELLIMANVFDDLCTGAETGTRMSPREAFAWLREHAPAGQPGQRALDQLG